MRFGGVQYYGPPYGTQGQGFRIWLDSLSFEMFLEAVVCGSLQVNQLKATPSNESNTLLAVRQTLYSYYSPGVAIHTIIRA